MELPTDFFIDRFGFFPPFKIFDAYKRGYRPTVTGDRYPLTSRDDTPDELAESGSLKDFRLLFSS